MEHVKSLGSYTIMDLHLMCSVRTDGTNFFGHIWGVHFKPWTSQPCETVEQAEKATENELNSLRRF